MAARMKAAPKHCRIDLGSCMRAKRGPGTCMKQFHKCLG